MGFADDTAKIWPVPPDWAKGVSETLAWGTDVMAASASAVSQHRSWRATPRRAFSFEILAKGPDRQLADMLLAGYAGVWQLPVWPDQQWLASPLSSGVTSVPCATAGFDFVDGGKALLFSTPRVWEVVEVDSVASDHLGLASATAGAFGRGSRLFPLRAARVRQGGELRGLNDDIGRAGLTFDIVEPCAWPLLEAPTQYLGYDVLDRWPDESDDPTSRYIRLEQSVDDDIGFPVVHDLAGVALRAQQSAWKLFGRAEHTWFRSMVYGRSGRLTPIWVPSVAADLQLASPIAANSAILPVSWCGYTQFGLGKPNRQDLRIVLNDGTAYYRRVNAAAEDGDAENLTLDSSLSGSDIDPGQVRAISFMALSTLASDEVEIEHDTDADGVATSTTGWQAVVPDV